MNWVQYSSLGSLCQCAVPHLRQRMPLPTQVRFAMISERCHSLSIRGRSKILHKTSFCEQGHPSGSLSALHDKDLGVTLQRSQY